MLWGVHYGWIWCRLTAAWAQNAHPLPGIVLIRYFVPFPWRPERRPPSTGHPGSTGLSKVLTLLFSSHSLKVLGRNVSSNYHLPLHLP